MRLLPIALLIIALAQFAAPALPALGLGQSIGARATGDGLAPELPPGVFFSIWGVIFTGYLGVSLIALAKPDHVVERVAGPLALAGLGNVAWMLAAQLIGSELLNFVLLLPILFFAWEAAHRLNRMGGFDGTLRRLLICLTVGLLAGWISVAVSISVPGLVREMLGRGATDAPWASLWLALVPAAALAVVFTQRVSASVWYYAALIWGLAGLAANNWLRTEMHFLAVATVIAGLMIVRFRASHAGKRMTE